MYTIDVPYIIVESTPVNQQQEPLLIDNEQEYQQTQSQQQQYKQLLAEQQVPQGETPGNIILERVMAYPELGKGDAIILRNIGGQTANLTGWVIKKQMDILLYEFGTQGCEYMAIIHPMSSLEITRLSKDNLCGFIFGLSFQDEIAIFDSKDQLVAGTRWESSEQGSAIRLINTRYIQIQETTNIMEVLKQVDEFSTFRWALSATGLDSLLVASSNPDYTLPERPAPPSPVYDPQFPWWFGFAVDRATLSPPPSPPPPPPPPPFGQVPDYGPYTIFAPTNQAFENLQVLLTGGHSKITLQRLFRLPEFRDIMLYHIYYGMFTTSIMNNNTSIMSTLGASVVISKDPGQTEGFVALNDACTDRPTRGFTCQQQLEYGKCYDPYMLSQSASRWLGGFCQKTCKRCTCRAEDGAKCARIIIPDLLANNGVIHGINRVLFPPPIFGEDFDEEDWPPDVEDAEEDLTKSSASQIEIEFLQKFSLQP